MKRIRKREPVEMYYSAFYCVMRLPPETIVHHIIIGIKHSNAVTATKKIDKRQRNTLQSTFGKRWLNDELCDKESNKQDPVARTGSKPRRVSWRPTRMKLQLSLRNSAPT